MDRSGQCGRPQFTQAQWEVSTGKRLRVPSDDPSGTQRAVLEQSNIDSLDAYSSAAGSASARLTALDTTLGSIGDQISAALTALQSSLGSTATQPVRRGRRHLQGHSRRRRIGHQLERRWRTSVLGDEVERGVVRTGQRRLDVIRATRSRQPLRRQQP